MPVLPDLMKEFNALRPDLEQFRTLMQRALKSDLDEGTRRHLEALGRAFDSTFSELQQKLPEAAETLKHEETSLVAAIEKTQARGEELLRTYEEAQSVRAAVAPTAPVHDQPAAPEADVRQYRMELLDLLNDRVKTPEKTRAPADREIWQDWSKLEDQ